MEAPARRSLSSRAARTLLAAAGTLFACVVCAGGLLGQHELFWWNQRRMMMQAIEDNAYPGATLLEETSLVAPGYPGDVCWVTAYGTFQAQARMRDVRQWYAEHPEGVSYYEDGRGLDRVARDRGAGTVVFRVMKRVHVPTLYCPER
jgi:hypothetical protein